MFRELFDRELEVLRLIASSLGNAEIANFLNGGLETVENHVSKLLLADRAQAAVWRDR